MGYPQPSGAPTRPSYIPHPKEYAARSEGPFWGSLGAIFGGVLVVSEGIFVGVYGPRHSLLSSYIFTLPPTEEAWFMIVLGTIIAAMGWLAYHTPDHHRGDAAGIWLLAFLVGLSLSSSPITSWVVSYFVPGLLLAYAGAAHIWSWKPRKVGGADAIRHALGSRTAGLPPQALRPPPPPPNWDRAY